MGARAVKSVRACVVSAKVEQDLDAAWMAAIHGPDWAVQSEIFEDDVDQGRSKDAYGDTPAL